MIRKAFTLLEVMIAIVLLSIVSSLVSIKMTRAVEKKKFQSDVDRLKARMGLAQKLAMAMQADWTGCLEREGDGWIFYIQCDEISNKQLTPLHIASMEISLNQKKIGSRLDFDFYASGHSFPDGTFLFKQKSHQIKCSTLDLYERKEGNKSGPSHPST